MIENRISLWREQAENARRTGRWTPQRKDALLNLLKAKAITTSTCLELYGFSADELDEWSRRRAAFGTKGLKVLQLQACGHV